MVRRLECYIGIYYELCDEIAQMVEQWTVEPEAPGSSCLQIFCAMLLDVTSNRVYKIPTIWTYDRISVNKVQ